MSNKKFSVRVWHFKLSNPVINIDTNAINQDFYSYKFFEAYLQEIIKSANPEYIKDLKYIELISLKQSSDADIVEGVLHSLRFGTENDIINISTKTVVNTVQINEGLNRVINFVINRKTGYMIIQSDPQRVATRGFLVDYFSNKIELGRSLINDFNRQNHPSHIADSFLFTLTSLYEKDFWEQLEKLARIKQLKLNTTVDKSDNNSALAHLMLDTDKPDDFKLDGITSVEYVVKNEIRNKGLSHVKRFVKNLIDFEKVSTIRAEGYNEHGDPERALFNIVPKTTFIVTSKNEKGVIDQSKLVNGMITALKNV